MKFKNITILVLSATLGAGIVTHLSLKKEYNPTLGIELRDEAIKVQEKYRKLKAEGKTPDDFTKPIEESLLEERVKEEQINEYYNNPTGNLYLQRASFKKEEKAIRLVKKLRDDGLNANYFKKDKWNVVYLGPSYDISDVTRDEEKFYSNYPSKYVLLKGPINTKELRTEKEKNLVRSSLVKISRCLKKKDECILNYVENGIKNRDDVMLELYNCDPKFKFKVSNITVKEYQEGNVAHIKGKFKFYSKCYDAEEQNQISLIKNRRGTYFLPK